MILTCERCGKTTHALATVMEEGRQTICPICWHRDPPPITPEQIIQAALAPPAATLRMTDDTTDEELSDFIRGNRDANRTRRPNDFDE
jgi:hypothetical protein